MTPAFTRILDDHEGALPRLWPLPTNERTRLAWWISAQLLRTKRQRSRLQHIAKSQVPPAPPNVSSYAANNLHLDYMAKQMGALAYISNQRPWGLGWSDACLLTSDVPVEILNNHDADDQLDAASYWEILLTLDSHRFLLLPHLADLEEDPHKRRDHMIKLPGGMGVFLAHAIYDAADLHIFHHPDHYPLRIPPPAAARLPAPWTGDQRENSTGYVLSYDVLPPGYTVERRWLDHV